MNTNVNMMNSDSLSMPAPRFTTSAAVSSGLDEFLDGVKALCAGAFTLTFARAAETQTAEALKLIDKHSKKAGDAKTGLIVKIENAATGKVESAPVTVSMIDGWMSRFPPFKREFATPGAFLYALKRVGEKNTTIINARAATRADVLTAPTMLLHSPATSYKYSSFPLVTRHHVKMTTEADREYIYRHLRKNGKPGHEILFWITPERSIPVPREEKSGFIPAGDDDFWSAFYAKNDQKTHDILAAIEAKAYQFEQSRDTSESGLPQKSFDEELLSIAPQALLRFAVLTRRTRVEVSEEGKAQEVFDAFLIECSLGGTDRSGKREKWHEALSRSLLYEIDLREVEHAPQFSNIPGKGLVCIPLAGERPDGSTWSIDISGAAGKHAAESGLAAPALPSEFARFFFGEDGSLCFFASDPAMSQLRLADFLFRVLVDRTYSRQCLTLAGSGKDGKSILIKVLSAVLGVEEATLNTDRLDDPACTYSVLNAPLVVMPEVRKPSQVFASSFFKSVTGGDTLQLRKLFCMAVDWTPEHTRLMMTTNSVVFVAGDAQVSRCLPIACQKAYTPRTARPEDEIIAACLSQRVEFLQWVCDTVTYYRSLKAPNGDSLGLFMPDRLMIVTDSDFRDFRSGARSLLDMSERERRQVERLAMESTGVGRFIVTYGDESSEDEVEWYSALFEALFDVDASSETPRSAVSKAIIEGCELTTSKRPKNPDLFYAIKALGISTDNLLHDKRFKAFKAWAEQEGRFTVKKNRAGIFVCAGVRLKEATQAGSSEIEKLI